MKYTFMCQILTEFQYLSKTETVTTKRFLTKKNQTQLQTKRCFDGDARKQCWTPGISRTTPFPKWWAVCELDGERKLILFYGLLHPGSQSCLQERFKQTLFGSLVLSGSLLGVVVQVGLEDLGAQAGGKLCMNTHPAAVKSMLAKARCTTHFIFAGCSINNFKTSVSYCPVHAEVWRFPWLTSFCIANTSLSCHCRT